MQEWLVTRPALASEPHRSHDTTLTTMCRKVAEPRVQLSTSQRRATLRPEPVSHIVLGGRPGPWSASPANPTPGCGDIPISHCARPSKVMCGEEGTGEWKEKGKWGSLPVRTRYTHAIPAPIFDTGTVPGMLSWV